jgi:CBS domain containing-hemolysin-like protein
MPDDSSSAAASGGSRWWRGLFGLIFGEDAEPTLRAQIEEAIEEREGEPMSKGDLSSVERQMLRNLLHFGERTADDISVPRADIIAVPETISFPDLIAAFVEAGHSRLPVYRDNLDCVIGMVHVKDAFAILAVGGPQPANIEGLLREPRYVPESMSVLDLLAEMRTTRTHLAIVVDEYSGTAGLVTIEDLVEEIVGEIEDEYDEEAVDMLVPLDGGAWDADARAELDDVAATVDPRLAEVDEDVQTLGGLVSVIAGHVPQAGEMVQHESGWTLEIMDGDRKRVTRLRLHPPAITAPQEED